MTRERRSAARVLSGGGGLRALGFVGAILFFPAFALAQSGGPDASPTHDREGRCATEIHAAEVQANGAVFCIDTRIHLLAVDEIEVTTFESRRLFVSIIALYRVADPELFVLSAASRERGERRLSEALTSRMRAEMGGAAAPLEAVILERVQDGAAAEVASLGLELLEVRARRIDLPPANLLASLDRMAAEQRQIAAEIVASGEAIARRRRAQVDRETFEIETEARIAATVRVSDAIAERAMIAAAAYAEDPEFFELYGALIGPDRSALVGAAASESARED